MGKVTIRDVKVYVTAPRGINLVVVKVETSEPELYGLGCATFTWRHKAVVTAIDEYIRPMVIGRDAANIEAMGELFTHPLEWKTIVQNQWIDFIRVHLSDIGGLTPARKLAHFCESYGVRTAWHGPNDLSPIGAVAQMHLDLCSPNFGIQEFSGFSPEEEAVFPGCPSARKGYVYLSEAPGIGVGFDEKAAAKFPAVDMDHSWLFSRLPDGTPVCP